MDRTIGSRRGFVKRSCGIAASAVAARAASGAEAGPAFSNRAHLFVSRQAKERFVSCFSEVVGCGAPMTLHAAGISEPILAFRFPGGGSLSVEFTDDALDERQARRGAWLEIWSGDPPALARRVLEAGLSQVTYPATNTFYFAAPGGQVFGIVSGRNPSAGELRPAQ